MISKGIVRGLLVIGAFGVAVAAYAAFEMLVNGHAVGGLAPLIGSFACFGLLLGGVHGFDKDSPLAHADHPGIRTAVGALAGLSVSLIWHWPPAGAIGCVAACAALGHLGMRWAKYVDF